jgi:beta-N-acetylhexosaminidase
MNFRSWSIKHIVCHLKSSSYISIISKLLLVFVLVLAYSCAKKTPTKTTPPSTQKTPAKPKDTTATAPKTKAETKAPKAKVLNVAEQIDYLKTNSPWVDSVFSTLTLDERIAQLIMFDAYAFKNKAHLDTLIKLVKEQKIGGLIFLKGSPVKQVKMINSLQAVSKVPLLIAMDAEYGIGMRLDSANKYPFQMTLGAIQK